MYPENFILDTDYTTLKNDALVSIALSLPNIINIPAGQLYSNSVTTNVGVQGASIRSNIISTKNNIRYQSNNVYYLNCPGGSIPGSPVGYDLYISVHRVSATEARVTATIPNAYGAALSITGLAQTITANIATFLPPTA